MEDNGSGYEAGSEKTLPSSSSSISLSDCKKKKPCEICGSNANDHMLMTCFSCKETREHTYCVRVFLQYVPPWWICETCSSSSRVAKPDVGEEFEVTANSRPIHADNEEDSGETATSRTNRVDNQSTISEYSCNEISATSQPSQAQAHTSQVASSPVREQKQSDSNIPSDSESAK